MVEFTQLQAAILASASKLLKPDGRLVYTTCSHRKNCAIVDAFLAEHPEFAFRPAGEILAQQKIPLEAEDYMQLLPQLHSTDAFFAAVLERVTRLLPTTSLLPKFKRE